jgi:hypothetical protein
MTRWAAAGIACALIVALSGCDQLVESLGENTAPAIVEQSGDVAAEPALPDLAVAEFAATCSTFTPAVADTLGETRRSPQTLTTELTNLTLTEWALPGVGSERFNAVAEICPGWLIAATNGGQTVLIEQATGSWVASSDVERSGTIEDIREPGIESGGPTYGIRDLVVAGESTWYSVGVVDETQSCLRMEVRRVTTEALWVGDVADSSVVYSSTPCVDFSDERRGKAPLKIHLGGALAVDRLSDTVYVTIGDYHLGASRISQAASAGIESTDLDYALLGDGNAAISALVAITTASSTPTAEISSKGLRNSLGLTQDGEGRLWLSEMGPGGGDELNLMERGADYGWPLTSPGAPYDRSQWPSNRDELPAPYLDFTDQDIPGTTPPVRVWNPAIAPSQVVWIPAEAQAAGEFAGMLALGSLRDEAIYFLDQSQPGVPAVARVAVGQRLRNMTVDHRGALWAVSDSGTLLRVSAR